MTVPDEAQSNHRAPSVITASELRTESQDDRHRSPDTCDTDELVLIIMSCQAGQSGRFHILHSTPYISPHGSHFSISMADCILAQMSDRRLAA